MLLERGDHQGAADLYGASLAVAFAPIADASSFTEKAARRLATRLGLMAAHVEVDLPESERQGFYELMLQSLARIESDLGELLRPYLDEVIRGLDELGVFQNLRDESGSSGAPK